MAMKGFDLHVAGFGSVGTEYLRQLQNVDVDPRLDLIVQGGATLDPLFAGVIGSIPLISFDTPALATMLGIVGLDGAAVDQSYFWFAKLVHGGSVASGSVHTKFTLYQGLALLRTIRATQGSEAIASYELIGTFDGTNAPLAIAITTALVDEDQAAEKFTVGPVILDAAPINVSSIRFTTGLTTFQKPVDGEAYPRLAAMTSRRSQFTITTPDVEAINAITTAGAAVDDVRVFFRHLTNKGGPTADATESHIKMTAAAALVTPGPTRGSSDGDVEAEFTITPIDNQTDAVLEVDTSAAIV